jgi:hypothetical protein
MLPADAPWDLAVPAPRYLRPSSADDVNEFARLVEQGLVRRVVADVHVGLDAPDERRVRAGAVAELMPERLLEGGAALTGADAAWLYAGGEGPERLHVVMPVRRGRAGTAHVVVHEGRVPAEDVEDVDGVPVTSPARAAADVARGLPPETALPLLRRLGAAVPLDPRDALVHLERLSGCRGVEAGRQTVLTWAAERAAQS